MPYSDQCLRCLQKLQQRKARLIIVNKDLRNEGNKTQTQHSFDNGDCN